MRKNLALYFTLGFPDQETLQRFSSLIDSERVDYVEFGFPSENPIYDGPRIRATHKRALEHYAPERNELIFSDLLARGIKLYSLTYYRDIRDKREDFLDYLIQQNFSGIIIPDLLVDFTDRAIKVIEAIQGRGLSFIPFFNPATPDKVVKVVSEGTDSWIYYGLQPSTGISVPFDAGEVATRIRNLLPGREINFGFGIRTNDQIRELMNYNADGVAIGTALIDMLDRHDERGFSEYLSEVRGVLDGN